MIAIPRPHEPGRGLRGPVLGIDPSLNRTGWALVDEDGLLVQSGSVRSKVELQTELRIFQIAYQLGEVFTSLKRKPAHLVIEHQTVANLPGPKLFGGKRGKSFQNTETALALSRLEGAIVFGLLLQSAGKLDVLAPVPLEWRRLLGVVVTRDTKEVGVEEVKRRLRLSGIPFAEHSVDELEAIGIAFSGRIEHSTGYPLRKRREENAQEKVDKRARKKTREAQKRAAGVQLPLHMEEEK